MILQSQSSTLKRTLDSTTLGVNVHLEGKELDAFIVEELLGSLAVRAVTAHQKTNTVCPNRQHRQDWKQA